MKSFLLKFSFLISFLGSVSLLAQPVSIDGSFASNGTYTFSDGATEERFKDVVVQSNGQSVLLGNTDYDPDEASKYRIVVMRLNQNGQPDNSFGTSGKVYIDYPNSSDIGNAIALQQDGKILIAGQSTISNLPTGTLFRLNSDGSIDTGFGNDGRAYIDGEVSNFRNLAIQNNGNTVVSGYGFVTNSQFSYLIARFNTNGQKDNTFNGTGLNKFRTSTSSTREDNNAGFGIALQSDGRIIACGSDEGENGTVVRLKSDGTLDNTFGSSGVKIIDFTRQVYLYSLKVQSDGRIVIAGDYDYSASTIKATVIRLLDNGNFDNAFSSVGFAYYGNSFGLGKDIAIQSDGKYLITGGKYLMRINATNGSLDTSFDGQDGILEYPDASSSFDAIALDNNKIYLAGAKSISTFDKDGIVTRVNNNFSTGISSLSVDNQFITLYPNPAFDKIVIDVKDNEFEAISLSILNAMGQTVLQKATYENANNLDISTLAKGLYFVRIEAKDGRKAIQKFIKN
jgi:uncharacterized delta-60 repeat protein